MAVNVKNLIAAINPDVYCDDTPDDNGARLSDTVKKIAKTEGYLKAAEKAKIRDSEYLDIVFNQLTKNAFEFNGLKYPIETHSLTYDDFSQNLEPIYFWILDYVNYEFGEAEKLVDNFISSPGGGHFAEMSRRATALQDEAMKIFGTINNVIRSLLNLIYDLKEFKLRLALYDEFKSSDKKKKEAAYLSLKQVWMDNVDIKRGNGSINMLAQNLDFVTIRDAFMASQTLKGVDNLDLNERVKRILKQRQAEFEKWIEESERELRKRFEIERTYLKSQVNSVRLYARWAKPYLKAARQLEQNASPKADLVNFFNTSLFELVLLAKGKYDPKVEVATGDLPKIYKKLKLRKYTPITIIEFSFRTAPDRSDQRGGYGFRGKVKLEFTSFALNDDELAVLKQQLEEDDFGEVYRFIEGATEQSLGEIRADLDELLGEGSGMIVKKNEKKSEDTNPFTALFSFLIPKEEKIPITVPANWNMLRSSRNWRNIFREKIKKRNVEPWPTGWKERPGG